MNDRLIISLVIQCREKKQKNFKKIYKILFFLRILYKFVHFCLKIKFIEEYTIPLYLLNYSTRMIFLCMYYRLDLNVMVS